MSRLYQAYQPDHTISKPRDYRKIIWAIITSLAILLMVLSVVAIVRGRTLFLVNGLDRPYEVEINGESFKLLPLKHQKIKLREGEILVQIAEPGFSPFTAEIKTPFWARLLNNRTFIINPDGTAVLMWEKMPYFYDSITPDPSRGEQYDYRYYAGKVFWEFRNIDYVFTDFPEKVETKVIKRALSRERLSLVAKYDPSLVVNDLVAEDDIESLVSWSIHQLENDPLNSVYLYYLKAYYPAEDLLAFVRQKLEERPVLVDWHRFYQEHMYKTTPEHDLVAEYTAYLAKEPGDSSLQYLLGRAMEDPFESEKIYLQSVENDSPSPYGYYGLAFLLTSRGEFAEANRYLEKALALMPEILDFTWLEKELMWALGKYDELLARVEEQGKIQPYNIDLVTESICLYAAKGELNYALYSIEDFMVLINDGTAEGHDSLNRYLQAVTAYAGGEVDEYLELLSTVDRERFAFEISLTSGQLADAMSVLDQVEHVSETEYLLLYIAAKNQSEEEMAESSLQKALEMLKDSPEERYFAACLTGSAEPAPDKITHLAMSPYDKSIILTALGLKYPQHSSQFFALADKLNYYPKLPYLFLKDIHRR